jgi:hypothetical protein
LSARLGEGADEKLVGFGGVGTGDGAFRVDLRVTKKEGASDGGAQRTGGREETYGLAVEVVLPGHNGVDGVGLREGKEGETTGTSRLLIAHDGAVGDSTELLEVGLERLCKGRKTRSELFVVSLLSQATKETDRRLCPSSGHRWTFCCEGWVKIREKGGHREKEKEEDRGEKRVRREKATRRLHQLIVLRKGILYFCSVLLAWRREGITSEASKWRAV